jgi:hypothetical protein
MYLFAGFMNSMLGRWVRFVGGAAMIVGGLWGVGGVVGMAIAAVGLIPLAAGGFDICMLAPVLRTPFAGEKVRAFLRSRNLDRSVSGTH